MNGPILCLHCRQIHDAIVLCPPLQALAAEQLAATPKEAEPARKAPLDWQPTVPHPLMALDAELKRVGGAS